MTPTQQHVVAAVVMFLVLIIAWAVLATLFSIVIGGSVPVWTGISVLMGMVWFAGSYSLFLHLEERDARKRQRLRNELEEERKWYAFLEEHRS